MKRLPAARKPPKATFIQLLRDLYRQSKPTALKAPSPASTPSTRLRVVRPPS